MNRRGQPGTTAFTVVELLVAGALAMALLAAAWGWLWSTASAARRADARAQAATAQAFAARMLRAELSHAVALCLPEEGVCDAHTVTLASRDTGTGARELTAIGFDGRRGVLWRKAPASYLAEEIRDLTISYYARDGAELTASDGVLSLDARRRVVRVVVEWTVDLPSAAGHGSFVRHTVEGVLPSRPEGDDPAEGAAIAGTTP